MNIYVASSMRNKQAVREAFGLIFAAGHRITHDWTVEDASLITPGSFELEVYLEYCGRSDLHGVQRADALIVLAHPDMKDTRAEIGLAIGLGKPVYVVAPERATCVFYFACICVPSVVGALRAIDLNRRGVSHACCH